MGHPVPAIRLTAVLVEDSCILLVKQHISGEGRAHWSLPGGKLELGETLEQGLKREMLEETGLEIQMQELLYISDRFRSLGHHLVDMSFRVRKTGGSLSKSSVSDGGREILSRIEFVPVNRMTDFGMSDRFQDLVERSFPGKGRYVGDFHDFY